MAQSRTKSGTRRKTTKKTKAGSGSPLWPWFGALAVIGGGIALYDNSSAARHFLAGLASSRPTQLAAKSSASPEKLQPAKPVLSASHRPVTPASPGLPEQSQTAAIVPPAPIGKPVLQTALPAAEPPMSGGPLAGAYEAKFFLCGSAKQDDCVLSADRFVFHGQKIRLVGIEVPDIKKPRCEAERIKASDAELRVRAFLDSGPFELVSWQGNGDEIEGHKLRVVTRNGRSLADILVNEGFAKRPGAKAGWC